MEKWRGKWALVTGASSGIGWALAEQLAAKGANLVLTARRADRLTRLAQEVATRHQVRAEVYAADLARPQGPGEIFRFVEEKRLPIEILINNAGFGAFGEFAEMPEEKIFGQIALNITALTELTRLFLPMMIARRSGRVMNVASTAAFQPGPLMAVYYATKAYVLSFSEAIANEVRGSGVTVTCFCPGATHTGFAQRSGTENSRLFKQFGVMSAEKVARDGYRALMDGRTVAISGAHNWVVAQSTRFAPRKMVTAISRWIGEKTG
jgi:uncharacterized protein